MLRSPKFSKDILEHYSSYGEHITFLTDQEYVQMYKKEYEDEFKVTINSNASSGWMQLKGDIDKHTDNHGNTLVYCTSGNGRLFVNNKWTYLEAGRYTIFNDYLDHFVQVIKPMRILVLGISRNFSKPAYFKYKLAKFHQD